MAFCDVTKKEKIQVYYIDVTNLTDGKMNGRMNAEKTYELDREDSYYGKLRNQRIPWNRLLPAYSDPVSYTHLRAHET